MLVCLSAPLLPLCQTMRFIPRKLSSAGAGLRLVCDELRISYAAYAALSAWQLALTRGVPVGTAPV